MLKFRSGLLAATASFSFLEREKSKITSSSLPTVHKLNQLAVKIYDLVQL